MKQYVINNRLDSILIYINSIAGCDIRKLDRHVPLPFYRALYCKIAFKVVPTATLSQIGRKINRDHSNIIHYRRKLIPEISKDINYIRLYNDFSLVSDYESSKVQKEHIELILSLEHLENKYNKLLEENENNKNIIEFLKNKKGANSLIKEYQHTENELKYRELPKEKQDIFDMRAAPILAMLGIKNHQQNGVNTIGKQNISHW